MGFHKAKHLLEAPGQDDYVRVDQAIVATGTQFDANVIALGEAQVRTRLDEANVPGNRLDGPPPGCRPMRRCPPRSPHKPPAPGVFDGFQAIDQVRRAFQLTMTMDRSGRVMENLLELPSRGPRIPRG